MNENIIGWIGNYCAGTLNDLDAGELRKWIDASRQNKETFCKIVGYIKIYNALSSAERLTGIFDMIAERRRKAHQRRSLLRRTAAASISVIIGVVIIMICMRWHDSEKICPEKRIPPGSTKATLVLADGSSIALVGESHTDPSVLYDVFSADGKRSTLRYDTGVNWLNDTQEPVLHTINVPPGGEYRLTLADGTKVWLNSATSITYPTRFDGPERNVSLVGEAYFDVTEDRKHPFTVEFGAAKAKVTGTRLSILAYPECSRARVTLEEGGACVGYNGEVVELIPGTQALIDKKNETLITYQVDTRQYTAWVNGVFEYVDMKLYDCTRQLSRWYDVDFRFAAQAAENSRFTGVVVKYDDLNKVLTLIEKSSDLDFVIEGRTITVAIHR